MTADHARQLETALLGLEGLVKNKRRPTRHHARDILLPLGHLILEQGPDGLRKPVERIERATSTVTEEWARAVQDELTLACTEHVQSVDPRYLQHPRYDFDYTVAARERLEARLRAASELSLAPSEELLQRVAQADALLEPYLRTRQGHAGGPN